jgi:type I restriction enzyme, S subunit
MSVSKWRSVQLGEAVEINPRPARGSIPDDIEVSFVPMTAVGAGNGEIDTSNVRTYAEVKKGYTHFRDGDVLFAKITPCMENGKMAVARGLRNGIGLGSTEFHVLRPHAGVDSHYVHFFVSAAGYRKEAAHHMIGAVGQKRVPLLFLERSEIPLPPLDEQHRIVAEIEKQFSRLDEAVANLKRVKANLKRYKAAVLKAAVEGRLVPTEAELALREGRSYESGAQLLRRILDNRRSAWKGKGKETEPIAPAATKQSELPDGWAWVYIDQIAELVEYGSSAKANEDVNGVPVLRMGNIVDGDLALGELKYLAVSHEEFPKLLLSPGDLLFNRTNSQELVGKTAIFKGVPRTCSFASYLIRVRLSVACMPSFVAAYINSVHGRAWVKTVVTQQVGQANVNGTKLKALNVPLPPLAEQHRIVAEVDRRLSIVREVEAEVDTNLKRAQSLRQAVLARAFSGLGTGAAGV